MNARQARRARVVAQRVLAYRAWADEPATARIPGIDVISDPRLHSREAERRLRRAQNGVFDTPARVHPFTAPLGTPAQA